MKSRIWELDALRGLALLGMVLIHFVYDLTELVGVLSWQEPGWYLFVKNNCGGIFLVISGISATLGSRCLRRGLQVFCCGLLCSAVTAGMYVLGLADSSILIYFGVLHCLGVCMVLWHWLGRLPNGSITALGIALAAVGLVLGQVYLEVPWPLIPLGLCPAWFRSSDYFPLLPNLGFFLVGAGLGRVIYGDKRTRFPGVSPQRQPVALLCAMGRHSLAIYLLHQPLLAAMAYAIKLIVQ